MPEKRLILVLILFAVLFGVSACDRETDESKIKKVIIAIQTAAEQKDVKNVIDHLSETYRDSQGNNREGIKALLLGYFFRYPKISVYINNLQINIKESSAQASFETVLTSKEKTGSLKDIIPQALGIYAFDVELKKESGDWKVTSASWEDIGINGELPKAGP